MSRTVDVSGTPMRVVRYLVASTVAFSGLVFALVIAGLLSGDGARFVFPDDGGLVFVVAFLVLWQGTTVAWLRRVRRTDGDPWAGVPREQLLGRFAGYGGLARYNQEKALGRLSDDEDD